MRGMTGDAGNLPAFVMLWLNESLILLMMFPFLEDIISFGKIIEDEHAFQITLVPPAEGLVCLNTGNTYVSRIPCGPVVSRLVTISNIWRREVFTGISLGCSVLFVFNTDVAITADL